MFHVPFLWNVHNVPLLYHNMASVVVLRLKSRQNCLSFLFFFLLGRGSSFPFLLFLRFQPYITVEIEVVPVHIIVSLCGRVWCGSILETSTVLMAVQYVVDVYVSSTLSVSHSLSLQSLLLPAGAKKERRHLRCTM